MEHMLAGDQTGESAAQGVGDGGTDSGHRRLVGSRDELGQHALGDGVKTVAVDGGLALEPELHVVDRHLGRETPDRGGDLRHGDQTAYVEDFVPGDHQDWPLLPSDLCQPDVAPSHSPPQASAPIQNESGCSGFRS